MLSFRALGVLLNTKVRSSATRTVAFLNFYTGQKCSALSRLYVASSVWNSGFKDQFLEEIAKIKVGPPQDWSNFMGPVMCVSVL